VIEQHYGTRNKRNKRIYNTKVWDTCNRNVCGGMLILIEQAISAARRAAVCVDNARRRLLQNK